MYRENAARAELQSNADKAKTKVYKEIIEYWKRMPINNYIFENDECVWNVKQLCSFKELVNEGRDMKNCVAMYASDCAGGRTAIFHISCHLKGEDKKVITSATVEVRAVDRSIVQVKGKCNTRVDTITLNVIKRWAQNTNLRVYKL
jgi:hypothetical protein